MSGGPAPTDSSQTQRKEAHIHETESKEAAIRKRSRKEEPPVLLAVTPPRTGERTLLGVENLLQSIAVPEPFSLELSGDADGVMLMARCQDEAVVRGQIAAHYPQARIPEVAPDEDPLRLGEGERRRGA